MKRVLLTGATGFIGRHCLPLLVAAGYEVHALSSGRSGAAESAAAGVSWHTADLLDPEALSNLSAEIKPTHLLHLAWYAEPGAYWTSAENFRWVAASLRLFQEFAAAGGRRVVVAGSCAEYDWQYGCCSEAATPLVPATLYGACKRALHLMLEAFARQAGMSAAWGRIFFLYGPHEYPQRLVASVVQSLLRGEPARCSHGNQIRDFLHVEDAAAAFVALLDAETVAGAVNIASGRPVALKDLIGSIAVELGREDLIRLGAVPAQANEPPLLLADVARLRDEVGWQPRYTLETGLAQTVEWWRRALFSVNRQETK